MDRAYTHLSVHMASQGEAFEGAFSHAGFRHPGPVLFYYLAATSKALTPFMSEEDSYRISVLALNTLAVALAAFLLAGLTPHRSYALLLMPLCFVLISPRALFDYWNPYPVPAMACAYLLSLVYLAHGRLWFLPLTAVLGSFVAQCHISTPPFLAATFLYALTFALLRARGSERGLGRSIAAPAAATLVVSLLMWLGPLVDWWRYGAESNAGVIMRSFLEEHRTVSLAKSFAMVWHLAAKKLNLFFNFSPGVARLLPLALILAVAGTSPRRGAFFHLRMLLLVSWLVTIWALSRSFQPLADYLITYFLALLVLACFLVLIAAIDLVARLLSRLARVKPAHCRLALCAIALASVVFTAVRHPDPGTSQKRASCELIRFADRFVNALNPVPGTLYTVTPATLELRGFSVFFALSMLEHGADFCFDDQWEHYVGRALTCSYRLAEPPPSASINVDLALVGESPGPRRGRKLQKHRARRSVQMDWVEQGEPRSFGVR